MPKERQGPFPPRRRHSDWWTRPPVLASILLISVLAIGTLGYMLVEGWGAWDSFYMTVITVATIGYSEVHTLTRAGQIYTSVLILGGVGTVAYSFTLLAAQLVESGLYHRWEERRRLAHMLDDLKNHFIVCGYGRIGTIVVDEFNRQRIPYVVIDRDPDRVHHVIEQGGLAVEADASREEVLKRVGVDHARGLIAAVGTDAENVYTVLSARLLRQDLFIISRAETDDAKRKLKRAGADRIVSPYQMGGLHIAQTALRPAVVDFLQLASSGNLELAMEQVLVEGSSSLAGTSIITANLRQRFGVVVIGILRADSHMEFNPEPNTQIMTGDRLVVLGRPSGLKDLEATARNP
jgi:voltage-gated potassium channel